MIKSLGNCLSVSKFYYFMGDVFFSVLGWPKRDGLAAAFGCPNAEEDLPILQRINRQTNR